MVTSEATEFFWRGGGRPFWAAPGKLLSSIVAAQPFLGQLAAAPPGGSARQHDVAPPGQRRGEALERLAAHHHRPAERQRLEPAEVGGQVPGQPAVAPDHAIGGARQHERDHGAVAAGVPNIVAHCGAYRSSRIVMP